MAKLSGPQKGAVICVWMHIGNAQNEDDQGKAFRGHDDKHVREPQSGDQTRDCPLPEVLPRRRRDRSIPLIGLPVPNPRQERGLVQALQGIRAAMLRCSLFLVLLGKLRCAIAACCPQVSVAALDIHKKHVHLRSAYAHMYIPAYTYSVYAVLTYIATIYRWRLCRGLSEQVRHLLKQLPGHYKRSFKRGKALYNATRTADNGNLTISCKN